MRPPPVRACLSACMDMCVGVDGSDFQLVLEFQQGLAVLVDSDLVGDVVFIHVHMDTFFLLFFKRRTGS